jgi:hypothetical protein
MRRTTWTRRGLALLAAAGVLAACDDGPTRPRGQKIAALAVSGVRIDARTFPTTGRFELGLLATDGEGAPILSDKVTVTSVVTTLDPGGTLPALAFVETRVQEPGELPLAAAIDIDDSGSMSGSDPADLRAEAAKVFWEAVLGADPENQVAFFDFGHGASTGFIESRMLAGWTKNRTELEAQLVNIESYGGTPLYESMLEVARWVDTTCSATHHNRVVLLLTDGYPNGMENRDAAIQAAVNSGIIFHTVGLGPASDLNPEHYDEAVAVVREIAEQTGGVYAAATDAAALAPIFQTLARVSSEGQIISAFTINPIPAPGTRVNGTVTVESGGATATATWSFVIPGSSLPVFRAPTPARGEVLR